MDPNHIYSRWPVITLISPEKNKKQYDAYVILADTEKIKNNKELEKQADEWSLPIEGFAEDGRLFRTGYPSGGGVAYVVKLADAGRRKKNPFIVSSQRALMKTLAEKIKNAGTSAIIDARWSSLDPMYFDAFLSFLYEFDCYKIHPRHVTEIDLIEKDDVWNRTIHELQTLYRWIFFARDLINHPPGNKTPERIASILETKLGSLPGITVSVTKGDAIKAFDLIWRVGKGAPDQPPVLVRIEYTPVTGPPDHQPIVLVGKGVIFDQGGISIKTDDEALAMMKLDASGAGNIAAVTAIAAELEFPAKIISYLPFVVNVASPSATLPGDIGILQDGTTVEITNTDAEGRLILADAVCHAVLHDHPELILTLASLSGDTETALGELTAGVFTDTEWIFDRIQSAGKLMEEYLAFIPLVRETFGDLKEKRDSGIPAALRNVATGSDNGDPIRAACFVLSPSFGKNILSAHIDMCGPAFLRRPLLWFPEGATGWGIRTITEFLRRYIKDKRERKEMQTGM